MRPRSIVRGILGLAAAFGVAVVCLAQEDEGPSAKAGDYTIRVEALSISDRVLVAFRSDRAPDWRKEMRLELTILAPNEVAAARIHGIEYPARAVDDQGREVAPARPPFQTAALAGRARPSYRVARSAVLVWMGSLTMAPPAPDAKSLTVESTLVLFEDCAQVEFSFPWGAVGEERESEGLRAIAQSFEEAGQRLRATLAVQVPEAEGARGPDGYDSCFERCAWVVWEDGSETKCNSSTTVGEGTTFEFGRALSQKGAARELRYRAIVRAKPNIRVPFRLEGIALPQVGPRARSADEELRRPHRFWVPEEEGGSIEFDLRADLDAPGQDQPVRGPFPLHVALARQQEDGTYTKYSYAFTEVDAEGHAVIANLAPGHYRLKASTAASGSMLRTELQHRLRQVLGTRNGGFALVNTRQEARVRVGESTLLHPVRYAQEVTTYGPAQGAQVPRDEVVFWWEPYPRAAYYRVRLSISLPEGHSRDFWLSRPVHEVQLKYAPQAGEAQGDDAAQYLQLKPGARYYWYVYAYDQRGAALSRGRGGTFTVE